MLGDFILLLTYLSTNLLISIVIIIVDQRLYL